MSVIFSSIIFYFQLLENKGILRRVYTQNIDALEFLAGLEEDKVVEAHGTFQRSYCVDCKQGYFLCLYSKLFLNAREDLMLKMKRILKRFKVKNETYLKEIKC